jgi:hypothetical protein
VTLVTDVTLVGQTGATLLHELERFLRRFVVFPTEEAAIAYTLWLCHTHRMDVWDSTPRIAFLSPEPGSGKTRALEVGELLVPRPVLSMNSSIAYLFRKIGDEAGAPTIFYDEADTVFGSRAQEHEDLRGVFNAGHRRGATAGRVKVVGKTMETEELPAYCALALAGLDNLPDTVMSRSVVVRMRRRLRNTEPVEPFRRREQEETGHAIRDQVGEWMAGCEFVYPVMPDGVEDRDADVWEALIMIAEAAGGDWPARARAAAVRMIASAKGHVTLGERLLRDVRTLFDDADSMFSTDIVDGLLAMDSAPWGDLRGKPVDQRTLARMLSRYGDELTPATVRIGALTAKGYTRAQLHDVWERYVPRPQAGYAVTSVTPSQKEDA